MPVEDSCPICTSSQSAKESFATAKVAEHVQEKAHRDDEHQHWIDEHTDNGTLAEFRTALGEKSPPR